jgi:hypothetical protein
LLEWSKPSWIFDSTLSSFTCYSRSSAWEQSFKLISLRKISWRGFLSKSDYWFWFTFAHLLTMYYYNNEQRRFSFRARKGSGEVFKGAFGEGIKLILTEGPAIPGRFHRDEVRFSFGWIWIAWLWRSSLIGGNNIVHIQYRGEQGVFAFVVNGLLVDSKFLTVSLTDLRVCGVRIRRKITVS